MVIVQTEIEIAAPIERCFDLARDIDVHSQTVWRHTKERAVGDGVLQGLIHAGETVTFEATHLGVRQRLTSKIVEFNKPYSFVDEMQKGAFRSLRHTHEFEERNGKTVMRDTLRFEAPFGIIGRIVEKVILQNYMKRFLEDRNIELKKLAERG